MEVLECWNFKIISTKGISRDGRPSRKQRKIVRKEIGDVLRQILASVSILPRLNEQIYSSLSVTGEAAKLLPLSNRMWTSSQTNNVIKNSQRIGFRSFSTGWHRAKTSVDYKPTRSFANFLQNSLVGILLLNILNTWTYHLFFLRGPPRRSIQLVRFKLLFLTLNSYKLQIFLNFFRDTPICRCRMRDEQDQMNYFFSFHSLFNKKYKIIFSLMINY